MKRYFRVAVLFVLVVLVLVVSSLVRRATEPESTIIDREKGNLSASFDKSRVERDPAYAVAYEDKLRFLNYRQAIAYNNEGKPDEAIGILDKLISSEQAGTRSGTPRSSRSYQNETGYYEAMQRSYEIKHDTAMASRARERRDYAMSKAEEAKRRERAEEGKSVGRAGE